MTWKRLFILVSVTGLFFAGALADARMLLHEVSDIPLHREASYWLSDWVDVEIPVGLESFQLIVLGSDDQFVQITDLISPDGKAYVSSGNSDSPMNPYSQPVLRNVVSLNRSIGVVQGTGTLIVPNSPEAMPIPAGKWRFRSLSHREPQEKTVSFTVIGRKKSIQLQNRIDAKVWVAPETHWETDRSLVNQVLEVAQRKLGEAGLDLRIVGTERLVDSPKKPMVLPKEMTEIALQTNDVDALNIYLMGRMEYQNSPVNGLACLGAPIGLNKRHGCFVSMYTNEQAKDVSIETKGQILAHEIAHYLGIFHTKDTGYILINEVLDPLSDTDSRVTGLNMMDPGHRSLSATFSPWQKKMMQLSPALK